MKPEAVRPGGRARVTKCLSASEPLVDPFGSRRLQLFLFCGPQDILEFSYFLLFLNYGHRLMRHGRPFIHRLCIGNNPVSCLLPVSAEEESQSWKKLDTCVYLSFGFCLLEKGASCVL